MADTDGAKLLMVEDDRTLRELLARRMKRYGFDVTAFPDAESAIAGLAESDYEVAVVDLALPGMNGLELLERLRAEPHRIETIMLTGHGSVEAAVEAIKRGAYHYLDKPVKASELALYVEKAVERRRLELGYEGLQDLVARRDKVPQLVGSSPVMRELTDMLRRLAPNPTPVLIEGETGTGKDVCARLLHELSDRRAGPYVALNCGALAEGLLENELFGHSKGAYTNAESAQKGLFEVADGGTLFIDEVCEMSLDIQKAFLRVLENGEFRRLGEPKVRRARVRVIAATNRRVEEEVQAGRFREDLYYRLNVLKIETIPLRDHPEDIPELVAHVFERRAGRYPKGAKVSPEALAAFQHYHWPGNVRELMAVIERGVILSGDGVVRPEHCPGLRAGSGAVNRSALNAAANKTEDQGPANFEGGEPLTLDELERRHVEAVLEFCEGNKTKAAKKLGISLRSLYRKLDNHELR